MKKKWSLEEINFLKENYPKKDRYYCAKKLNRPLSEIVYRVRVLKIKKNKSIDENKFLDLTNKESAYILGFMWADGYLTNDGRHFNVSGVEEDINKIEFLFDYFGNWCKHIDDRSKYGWRNAKTIIGSNKKIYHFLKENDYQNKSYISPQKILTKIPDKVKHYFYRGIVDGDGCFYYYEPKKGSPLRQFTITSSYEQEWLYMEELCDELNINYKIKLTNIINKKTGNPNKSSQFRITNKDGITKIGNYIYQNYDNIGLKRKYNKFKIIKNSYVSNKSF